LKYVRVNRRIFSKSLRLIGPDGEQLGIFPRELALKRAEEEGLDLVEVAAGANPPVCRIMDFSKYQYEQEKRERDLRKHQRQLQIKEVRLRPRIGGHDYEVKLKHVRGFLKEGRKVKIRMFFRGREISHKDLGSQLMEKFIKDIEDVSKIDKAPQMFGKSLIMVVSPK